MSVTIFICIILVLLVAYGIINLIPGARFWVHIPHKIDESYIFHNKKWAYLIGADSSYDELKKPNPEDLFVILASETFWVEHSDGFGKYYRNVKLIENSKGEQFLINEKGIF